MRKLSLKEIQQKELILLKKIDEFCTLHHVIYFLGYGTLIGAVRHQGFIPWDDDIDIMMPRPDYDKFIALRDEFCKRFSFTDVKTVGDKDYYYPFTKVFDINTIAQEAHIRKKFKTHIWIDIFPLDGVFSDDRRNNVLFLKQRIFTRILAAGKVKPFRLNGNVLVKFFGTLCIPIGILLNSLINFSLLLDKLTRMNSYATSSLVADVAAGTMKTIISKEDMFPIIKIQFEDGMFNIQSNYHEYLTQFYGDYMRLPPTHKRRTHNIDAWGIF